MIKINHTLIGLITGKFLRQRVSGCNRRWASVCLVRYNEIRVKSISTTTQRELNDLMESRIYD